MWPRAIGRWPWGAQTRRRMGFKPDAVLVGGEDLDRLARDASPASSATACGELFLNASCSSGVATACWRARGCCSVHSIALSASQPRCGKPPRARVRPPSRPATFRLHNPPSGGGSISRTLSVSSRSGLRTEELAPIPAPQIAQSLRTGSSAHQAPGPAGSRVRQSPKRHDEPWLATRGWR